jgi:septum formation protein
MIEPAHIDEAAVKRACHAKGDSADATAMALAELKAQTMAVKHAGMLVIGADQLLSCGSVWYDKPPTLKHAREQLQSLRGRTHVLHSAVCVAQDDAILWRHGEQAKLTMRQFSDTFLDEYLTGVGDRALASVGAYQLEGTGAQLFAKIEGDYFAILGLPLLPLLEFLRIQNAVHT